MNKLRELIIDMSSDLCIANEHEDEVAFDMTVDTIVQKLRESFPKRNDVFKEIAVIIEEDANSDRVTRELSRRRDKWFKEWLEG